MGVCTNRWAGPGRGRWPLRVAGVLVALGLLGLPGRGWAGCKVQSMELPVTMVGSRAIATVGINGTDVRLMVDSGAFHSVLTHAAAEQLDLHVKPLPRGMRVEGLTGEVDVGVTTVKRLTLRNSEIPKVEFAVGGNALGLGIDGVLGRNILAVADTEYDLAHGMIRLTVPTDECEHSMMAYWAGDKPVSALALERDFGRRNPAILAQAKLNGHELRVMFDSGAQSIVSLQAARRAGITDMQPAGKIRGAGRGEVDAWAAQVERFELDGEKISNVRMLVADFDRDTFDMLLGIDFVLAHRIYVSKRQQRVYFTYNGGPVFALTALEDAKARAGNLQRPAARASAADASVPADAEEPGDAAGYARRGAASAARLDFARALADLDRACALAPQVAANFVRRGAVHETMKRERLALRDFDTALQLDPAQSEARLRRAAMRLRAGDRFGAIADLDELDRTLPPQAHDRLAMGQMYQQHGLLERSLPQWTHWIAAHPDDINRGQALRSRCVLRTLLNVARDAALDDCDEAVDLQAEDATVHDSRGWLRLRRGESSKALGDFERALELKPDHAWSLYGRGIGRRQQGELAAGQVDIDAARKLLPSIDAQAGRYGLGADTLAP